MMKKKDIFKRAFGLNDVKILTESQSELTLEMNNKR